MPVSQIAAETRQAPGGTAVTLVTNVYYTSSDTAAGALAGELKYSIDGTTGLETFYAYDGAGDTVLQYTLKTWSDAAGNAVRGWVGTTTQYDPNVTGRVTATYQGVYLVPASPTLDGTGNILLDTTADANGTPQVADAAYAGFNGGQPLLTSSTDYNADGTTHSTTDQYGGTTTSEDDVNGHLLATINPDGTETESVYDASGRVILATDAFVPGQSNPILATRTVYNALGQVVATQRVSGVSITIATDPTDSLAFAVTAVSGAGLISSNPADPAAGTWSTDATGAWATAVAAGTTPGYFSQTLSYYNAQGQVAETVSAAGLRTGTIYYPDGSEEYTGPLLASVSDAAANPWYNAVPADADPSQYFVTWTQSLPNQVDAQGNLFSRTVDQLGHITDTYQDASGRTIETVYDDGSFTQTVYGVGDQPVTTLPAPMGWIVATGGAAAITLSPPAGLTIPAGGSETVSVAQRKLGDAPVVTYDVYDKAGNLVDVYEPAVRDADPQSATYGQMVAPHWHYSYDASGDELTQTDAKGRVTAWAYDESGNKVSERLPGGERQTWAYDAYGDVILHKEYGQTNGVTNATASRTTYDVYDTSSDGHGGRLLAQYRFAGDVNPTGTSPAGWAEKTVYTYDDTPNASQGELGKGGVLEVDDYTSANPSTPATFTRYAYDPVTGKQASVTTPEGTVNYRYDPATGELMETWTGTAGPSAAGTDVVYGYDDQGRLASVTQVRLDGAAVAAGATTVRYDADGNAVTTTQPTTIYAYDAVGNLQSTVEPDGQTTTYQYDDLNRLALETVTQGSTLVETFDYDQVLVTGTKNPDLMLQADGDRGGEVDTRYNASGGVVSQTTTAWTYDPDDRLTGETLTVQVGAGLASVPAAYTDAFHYDLANNRTEEDIDGGDTTAGGQSIRYVYDADDQLRTETETAYATATTTTQVYQTTYTYAYAGNLWTQTRTGTEAASDTYTYDLRDRMTKAVEAGTETDYGYDTDGVRVSEGSPGGTQTYYVNDPNNPTGYTKAIEEETGASPSTATTSRSYVLGTKVEAQSDATNGTLYLLTDGHGSTRALVNGAGQTVETYAYDAFGTLLAGTHTNTQTNVTTAVTAATAATEWLFGGDGLYDPASGWTYHLARWTNGFWFTTSDFGPTGSGSTSDPISLHKYLYTNADPTNVRDPSGHDGLAEALVTIGIGLNLAAIDLSLINGIRHTVQHWVSSSGVGGYDITRQLENLRADALKGWQTQTSFTQQALDLSYLTLSSPSNFWRAWDINELYSNRDLISPPGIASPGTVTVGGDVFWDDEVNYYWWGVITRLKDLHNAVGGVAPNTLNDATDTISEYRAAAWGGTDDAPRVAWAKAGYYGSLSYAGDTPLSHYTPGTQYPGFISAYFGEHDGPNTFIAVGSPF